MRGCRLSPSIKSAYSDQEISDEEGELERLTSSLGLLNSQGDNSAKSSSIASKKSSSHDAPPKTQAEPL